MITLRNGMVGFRARPGCLALLKRDLFRQPG